MGSVAILVLLFYDITTTNTIAILLQGHNIACVAFLTWLDELEIAHPNIRHSLGTG